MEIKVAFVGFGSVARAFVRLLEAHGSRLEEEHSLRVRATGIATKSHGCAVSERIDLAKAVSLVESGGHLSSLPGTEAVDDSASVIEGCGADLIFETTPLDPHGGQPAINHIRRAFELGMSVVTANKGPLAFAHRELQQMADRRGVCFRFEGAVMDGTPIFNLFRECLPLATVSGFSGVLNSTTNFILTEMESGRPFDDALSEAKRLRIAEANSDFDIDGWDAAVKVVALANVLMGADARPGDVQRAGIRSVSEDDLRDAAERGEAIRLIGSAERDGPGIRLRVAPRSVPRSSPLGSVRGTSSVLAVRTDLMGEITVVESDPGIEQTGYALLSDLLSARRFLRRRA